MGRRKKAARKPVTRMKQKLDTQFTCLFCNHEKAVSCTMDKKANVGVLTCKICGQSFQSPINSLSDAVDVYSDWVDACEAVAQEEALAQKNRELLDESEEEEEEGISPSKKDDDEAALDEALDEADDLEDDE